MPFKTVKKNNATRYAELLVEHLDKGIPFKKKELTALAGYKGTSINAGSIIEKTESAQKILIPFYEKLEKQREKTMNEIASRDLSGIDYEVLVKTVDSFTKNINLLTGRSTSNVLVRSNVNDLSDNELIELAAYESGTGQETISEESPSGVSEEGVSEETPA